MRAGTALEYIGSDEYSKLRAITGPLGRWTKKKVALPKRRNGESVSVINAKTVKHL
jgi:hypothetical protein